MTAIANEITSIEEYLRREERADYKSEYLDGRIVPMTGGTTNHNQIAGNIYTELNIAFKQRDFRVYMGDVRLWIPERRIFTYPDVMAIVGDPIYYENRRDTILNPTLIVEVLSPSTENYDKEGKFAAYRTLPTFQEYVLIGQTRIYGERFGKTGDKHWTFQEYTAEDRQIILESVQVTLDFTEIYHKVAFSPQ
ncbi:Uma2 family endonuclease [Pannus brasiliensis CCIBt3594]|uniref:Uma2 family endonuclease n=1 Tax=Pannus brasiliensis CCIBt3594 TaxID=1427578 RepID=A0AAW9QTI8_9CHRO